MKRQEPTIAQANGLFFITAVLTLVSSSYLQPKLGMGTNLWINEFAFILLPPLLIVKLSYWSVEDIFSFKKTSSRNKAISLFSGISMWLFVFYITVLSRLFLDNQVGAFEIAMPKLSAYQSVLLLIGMIVLAPVCEEIFFRGFVQKAYEGRKYGFVITGFIFGYYHMLNGISDVVPATILGICMGYLVYKTGSIINSMIFHGIANFTAVFLGGKLVSYTSITIPWWLHILAFSGLFISLILLKFIKAEPKSDKIIEGVDQEKKVSSVGIVFLILSTLYLTAIGAYEIFLRLKIV